MEVEVLKGCEVDREEKREGSPGKGDLGRSCLGFGNRPPPPRDPARAAAAATGTRPHNASLFSPPPAHTAPRHAAAGGRADEWPKT